MAKFKEDSEHGSPGNSAHAVTISAADYLGKNGKPGFDTPEGLLTYGNSLTSSDEAYLRKFFGFVKQGLRSDGGSELRKDVVGRQYQFITFYLPKSRPGVKLVVSGSLLHFFGQYQNGNIVIDFTLDDLIEEAKKSV
jgi:hypothetical protein